MRRYDFEPLEAVLVGVIGPRMINGQAVERPGVKAFAKLLGVDPRQIHRWRKVGVDRWQADAFAVAAGCPAVSIWPEFLDDAIADALAAEKVCEARDCDETFLDIPGRGSPQRFHSERCRDREQRRRRPKPERDGRTCAADDCSNLFLPRSSTSKFCTSTCRYRVSQRNYRDNPTVRQRDRERAAAYYVGAREYVLKRRRIERIDRAQRSEAAA